MSTTGVFPVHNNIFKIGTLGRASVALDMLIVKDLETFEIAVDNKTQEWTPLDTQGWTRRAITGKGITFKFKGKRNYGDPGNDYIAETLLATGQGVESNFEWLLPNGDKLTMDCVIGLNQNAGGGSTDVDGLEFDVMSDGLPVYTPAV